MAKPRQAHEAGRADFGTAIGQAYQAFVQLECVDCERVILPGEFFTRSKAIGGGNRTFTVCADCRPFKLRAG